MTYRLIVEKGRSKGKGLKLNPGAAVIVGRDASCTLRVVDAQASRKHFKVAEKGGEFVVEDLQSSNGTFVNGKRIDSKHMLRAGDKVLLGETLVYFLEELQSEEGTSPVRKGELTGKELEGYRIGRLLGRGGMGTVYEAQQLSLERSVAFKVLAQELTSDPALIERFVAEARAAGRLSHANIVAVFHVGQSGSQYFYSMEYMAGGSVEDLLRKEGKLDVARSIPIVFDAARGLEYAERHGLIHRDIKPANLMLGQDEVTKICDLGIATWQPGPQDACGSPHYIAPEQALGKPVDHRADLYALGVSWYHMLTGDTPFQGQSAKEICLKHVNEPPPPLVDEGVPEDVAAVVHKLMAKDPAERIPTARQLQADLAELARRYPVRETVMLRIDSVAPEDAPSAELVAPEDAPSDAPPATRAAVWAAVAFVAIGVMVAAFIGTTLVSRKAHAKAVAEARGKVDVVRGKSLSKDAATLEAARDEARALSEQLTSDGLTEPAREALQVADDAEKRRVELREAAAATRFAKAEALSAVPAGPPDEAMVKRLQQARDALGQLALELPDTASGREARALSLTVAARLEELEQALAEQSMREKAAKEAYDRTKQTVNDLLASQRDDRFKLAAERARELARDHGGARVAAGGAEALLAHVRKAAEEHAAQVITATVRLISEERFVEARAALEALLGGALGFPEHEGRVRDQLAALENAERSARQQQAAARDRERKEKVRQALEHIAADRQARAFRRAASTLRSEVALLPAEVRGQLETRAARLDGAAAAIDELVRRVNDGSCRFTADIEFPGGKLHRSTVTEAEQGADGVRFAFEYEPGRGRTLSLAALTWAQLGGALDSLSLSADKKVDIACLAFELDARSDGLQRLMRLQGDATVQGRVKALIDLAAAE